MTANRYTARLTYAVACVLCVFLCQAPAQTVTATHTGSPLALTLPAAVDMAIARNRKLELARLSVADSAEQEHIARSHYYPAIHNDSKVLHITALEGVVIPPGIFGSATSAGAIPPQTVRIDQGASTSYTSGTGLEQPLTQLLRVHAGVQAARADLGAAKVQAADAQNAIALQVHALYFKYLIEQLNNAAVQDALKAAIYTQAENQKAVQEGRMLADVELGSRADVLDKQRAVLISKLNLDDLTLQLDNVLGLAIGTKLQLDPNAVGDHPVLPTREEAMESVLQKSPTVLAAHERVEKAKAGVASARDAYIPNVTAVARYSYQSGLPFLVHNFGSFGASVSYDLFDGGAREATLRDARVKLAMAQTALAQDENDVRVEVSAAYDKVEQLDELVKVSALTLEAREERYRIEAQRLEVSAALDSGVAAAHSAATKARADMLTSKLALDLAGNEIKKLLGETPQ